MAITDLITNLLSIIDNMFYIIICLFLGGLVMQGWKRYKNWGLNLIGSVGFGVLCLIGGVLLSQVIPIQLPILEGVIQALITAVILYFILSLLSGDSKKLGKFVTSEQFTELSNAYNKLIEDFKRLKSVLERKKIMPEKLEPKDLEKKLASFLDMKGVAQFNRLSSISDADVMTFIIKDKNMDEYRVSFDEYTGENTGFIQINLTYAQKIKKALRAVGRNDKLFAGLVLAGVFATILLLLINDSSMQIINSKLNFMNLNLFGNDVALSPAESAVQQRFSNYSLSNPSCNTITDLLYLIHEGDYSLNDSAVTPASITTQISRDYPGVNYLSPIQVRGGAYQLVIPITITGNEFNQALSEYTQTNLISAIQDPMLLMQLAMGGSVESIADSLLDRINFCDISVNGTSVTNYVKLCSVNLNARTLCECNDLSGMQEYCFVLSGLIQEQLREQLIMMLNQLGSQAGGLDGLLGSLGGI